MMDPDPTPLYDPITLRRLARARDLIAANFETRLSVADAAREAALSPFHFSRLFSQIYRQTPHEFLTCRRMDRARHLLLTGDEPVTEICLQVGYESLGSFSTRFRSRTGLPPALFRREARRIFGGFQNLWPLYYIPACYQHFLPI